MSVIVFNDVVQKCGRKCPTTMHGVFLFIQLTFVTKPNVIFYDFKLFLLFLFEVRKKVSNHYAWDFPFNQLDNFDKI